MNVEMKYLFMFEVREIDRRSVMINCRFYGMCTRMFLPLITYVLYSTDGLRFEKMNLGQSKDRNEDIKQDWMEV